MKVYTLEMVDGAEYDCTRVEGIFSTREKAEATRLNLLAAYGRRDYESWITIDEHELDYDDRARQNGEVSICP